MECFGIIASETLVRPLDADFWKPRRGPNNAPKLPYGTQINYADYSVGFGGWRPFSLVWSYIEPEDVIHIYEIWDDARFNKHSRIWLNYFDVLAGEWRVNSAVMLEPKENGWAGMLYQNFTLSFIKLGVHELSYQGGASPYAYDGNQHIYGGNTPFANDGAKLTKDGS